jgi:plasmid maintenance system antidote protein VapI
MVFAVPILEELREMVRADDRSDRQIAITAGIHPNTFSAFMAGRRGLSVDTAEELAKALGRKLRVDDDAKPKRPKPRRR